MQFPNYIKKCLEDYPLEKIIIYIEGYLIKLGIKYNIVRQSDIIVKIQDENVVNIVEKLIKSDEELFSGENIIKGYLTIHELETNTLISFAYYDNLIDDI